MLSKNMMQKTFIIAEIGSIHDGSYGNALKAVELAKFVGADAVKFQTHLAEYETIKDAPNPSYFEGEPRYDYFERTSFSYDQWKGIKEYCDELEFGFISSPFSTEAVALLERVGLAMYKIPSGEITNLEMLAAVAKTGKPVILSSGMSNWSELDQAVGVLIKNGVSDLSVLQCSSAYPCPPEQVGLNIIADIKDRYSCVAGFSDHTYTNYAAFAAVTMGAEIIEKHLTFSRYMYGSDASLAAEPEQFIELVEGVRAVEKLLNNPIDKDNISPYVEMKRIFEKSFVAAQDIEKDTVIISSMLSLKKPGTGIPASGLKKIIGKKAVCNIEKDTVLSENDFD